MYIHVLTTEDTWFIEKGQKDSLSKTPFELGQEVVVCENHHVMLVEFYDGTCPTCQNHNTIPFMRKNVEAGVFRSYMGECPRCLSKVTILFRQQEAGGLYAGRCPKCSKELSVNTHFFSYYFQILQLRKMINMVRIISEWMIGLLLASVIAIHACGIVPNEKLIAYAQDVIVPRTYCISEYFMSLCVSDWLKDSFVDTNRYFIARNAELSERIADIFFLNISGLKVLCSMVVVRTVRLIHMLGQPALKLIKNVLSR